MKAHVYQKFSGFATDVEWCAVCWNGGEGEVKHADDPIHLSIIPIPPMKRITFIFDDDATGPYFSGHLWETLEILHNHLIELQDGDEQVFTIKRHDMTKEEIENLPVT